MEKKKKAPKPEEVRARIKELVQQTLQEALEAEIEEYLGYSKYQRNYNENSRNGYSSKTVKTDSGEVELNVPRDRKSEFEPQIVKKRQTILSEAHIKNLVSGYRIFC